MKTLLIFLLLCSVSYAQTNPIDVDYGGTQDVTHPDVIYFDDTSGEADGYNYWMVHTPYPPDTVEYPWVTRSTDGINWDDDNLTNPVVNSIDNGVNNYNGLAWKFDADPDWLYIDEYDKWFMIWGPRTEGNPGNWNRKEDLAFAYSSDGKSWTIYDGVTINGNTNPVILSGNDSNGQSWEREPDGTHNHSHTQYPTCVFRDDRVFKCWYGETTSGFCSATNNVGKVGCFTFTWNNETNDIENFARCNSGNYIFEPSDTASWCGGIGHFDVTIDNNGTYHMYGVRLDKDLSNRGAIWHYTSTDGGDTWGNGSEILPPGSGDLYTQYRPTAVHDGRGRQVLLNNKKQIYHSSFNNGASNGRISIFEISEFGVDPTFRKANTTKGLVGKGVSFN